MIALSHLLRGVTGEYELGRALWAAATLALILYQGAAIWVLGQQFSPVEFGTGAAAILAAGGFGIAAKDRGVAKAQAVEGGE